MKKMLCLLLCVLLCPVMAMADDSGASLLSCTELKAWAESYIARARTAQPLNDPASTLTEEGYEFVYDFAILYADTPTMSADTIINAVVLNDSGENGPRGVNVGFAMAEVLAAYYTENPDLKGSYESAVLYTVDNLPESAQWGQVNRDGQRVQTIQYAVHEQMAVGGEGYSDMGVIYTMLENRVSAVRVYGLNSRVSPETVDRVMYNAMLAALAEDYVQVPFSYNGAELTVFGEEDLTFSGLDFLHMDGEAAVALLGDPMADNWVENDDAGYIRVMTFSSCEVTFLYDQNKQGGSLYMICFTADKLEGPRAVRIGDSFASVYNRFRNGDGEFQEETDSEVLYGVENEGAYGRADYGDNASATLRYGFSLSDGRRVTLQMEFTIMELAEILLYVE